jgi:putative hemolysin
MKKTRILKLSLILMMMFVLAACESDTSISDNEEATTLVFETTPASVTAQTPRGFTCAGCGASSNAYNRDSLCGLCNLPEGAPLDIWNLSRQEFRSALAEMECVGTDWHHGGSASLELLGGYDELLELYALLSQDEETIVERLKKIACTPRNCACPYRTKSALNSIFTDFMDITELKFPFISERQPTRIFIRHEGHNNAINMQFGKINGMHFSATARPMSNENERPPDSLTPIRTTGETEIYLTREPSDPDDEYLLHTSAYFSLIVSGQYVGFFVSNPPCEMPSSEEMTGPWFDYRCRFCNPLTQGPRCFGAHVDVQAALDVIIHFEFRTLL